MEFKLSRRLWWWVVGVVVVPIGLWILLWLVVLSSANPVTHLLARHVPWPIVCSVRGCISTAAWQRSWAAQQHFARELDQEEPSALTALTTAVRHHLVHHAFLRTPLTLEDATLYRERILQATDEDLIIDTTGLTFKEYDTAVLLPLLQQEAVRQQRGVDSFDELYGQLAGERWVVVLPFRLRWDQAGAQVVEK